VSIKNIPLLIIPFLLAGCINLNGDFNLNLKFAVSIHPLYTDKEITSEPRLLGDWQQEDSNGNDFRFEKGDKDSYKISIIEDGKTAASFESYALKLDNKLYLDISPTALDTNGCPTNPLFLSTHIFAKITAIEPNLQIQLLLIIPDSLEKDPNFPRHETVDSYIVLTASTKELQSFIKAHADDKEVFGDSLIFRRLKSYKEDNCNDQ